MSQDQKNDQRLKTPEAEVPSGENPTAAEAPSPFTPERFAELEADLAKARTDVLYARAETENVRRRLEQQAEDRGKYAISNFAKDVLSVADNLRRALDAVPVASREGNEMLRTLTEGVEITERDFLNTLERFGIRLVAARGVRFDPNVHQAMLEMDDTTQPEGMVVVVMQEGYMIQDRLLRPAMVAVSRGGPKAAPGEQIDTSV